MLFIVPTVIFSALISAIIGLKIAFLLKEQLGLSASAVASLNIFLGIPTYLQPFVGAWTDIFAFFGYHRRSYYLAGKLMAAAGLVGLAALEISPVLATSHTRAYIMAACLLTVVTAGGVVRSVIFNAIMVALGNVTGRFGQLLSAVQLIPIVMAVAYTSSLSGYVAESWSYAAAFTVAAILTVISIPLVFLIDEQRSSLARHAAETEQEHRERLDRKARERKETRAAIRKAVSSPSLWALVGFVFYLILTPGTNNAKLYFEKDHLHFSRLLIGELGRYSNWGALAGFCLCGLVSRRIPIYMLAWGAWFLDCISYPVFLILHSPHTAMFLEVVNNTIGAVYLVCLYTLAARMCPKGLEGVIYGLVMSAIAFASTLSEKLGASLYDYYGPAHHYSLVHGWNWSLYFGFAFTVGAVVFIPFLPAWTRSRQRLGDVVVSDLGDGHAEGDNHCVSGDPELDPQPL